MHLLRAFKTFDMLEKTGPSWKVHNNWDEISRAKFSTKIFFLGLNLWTSFFPTSSWSVDIENDWKHNTTDLSKIKLWDSQLIMLTNLFSVLNIGTSLFRRISNGRVPWMRLMMQWYAVGGLLRRSTGIFENLSEIKLGFYHIWYSASYTSPMHTVYI